MAGWDDFPIVPASASGAAPTDKGWDAFPVAGQTAKPPGTFDALAPILGGTLGAITGGPLVHVGKRLLPKEWQDYITGVQRSSFQGAVMNFGDEALAGIGSATGGGSYDDLLKRERAASKEFREANPVGDTLGGLHGAVASTAMIPMGPLGQTVIQPAARAAPFVEKAGRMGARILERALKGAGMGAAFGYGSGFGEGEGGLDERLTSAAHGAQTGAMVGAGLNVGLPAAAAGIGKMVDAAGGVGRAVAGPQTRASQTDAAGQVIEGLSGGQGQTPRSGRDLLTDLATGQSTAPKDTNVPIPTANIMGDANLQAATRAELRRDPASAVTLREGREAGARDTLDPMRPAGAPVAVKAEIEGQDVARRAALDAAEVERQTAIREAQDAAGASRFEAREGVRGTIEEARGAGRSAVDDARAAGTQRLRDLETSLDESIAALRARGASEADAAHAAATDALMATGAFPDKASASRAALEAVQAELAANKRIGKGLYREVPPGTRLDVNPIYDTLGAVHREAYDSGRTTLIPNLVKSETLLDLFRNPTPQRLQGMKSMLYEEAARLSRNGDATSAKWARDVARSIDDVLAGASGVADSGVPELRAATEWWRERVIPYRQGAIGDILKVGSDGLPRIEPSTALGKIVKPTKSGGTEAIDQFIQAAGGRENALTAATEWAIADAAEYAIGRNGRIDLPKLNRWMRERAPALDALTGLRERLGTTQAMALRAEDATARNTQAVQRAQEEGRQAIEHAQDIVRAQAQAAQGRGAEAVRDVATRGREMMRQVEQRATEQVRAARDAHGANVDAAQRSVDEIQKSAAKLYLGTDPMRAAQGIMNSADPARAYMQVATRLQGNAEAQAGLRRSVFDALESELGNFATVDTPVRQGTRDIITANQPLLRAVFGDAQAARATELLRALEMSKAHGNVPGNVGSATAANIDQGALTETLLQHVAGRMSRLPVASILLNNLRTSANDAVRSIVREALFNPGEMRRVLEARVTRENAPTVARRLTEWMERRTAEGIPLRAMGDARDQERARREGRASGGRIGFDLGGAPDPIGAADHFGAILRSLRAPDTGPADPYGPAPSLVPSSPYPIYYMPPGGSGSGVASPTSTGSGGSGGVAGGLTGGQWLAPYDPGGGSVASVSGSPTGAGSVGPTGEGLSVDANAQSNTSNDNIHNPTAIAANMAARALMSIAPTPMMVSVPMAIMSMIGRNIGTAMSTQVGKTGSGGTAGVGNTSGVTANDANQGVSNPGEAASTPGPAGTTAEGGGAAAPGVAGEAGADGWARGGVIETARRIGRQRRRADGGGVDMARFGRRLMAGPMSQNVQDLRHLGPMPDESLLPLTRAEVEEEMQRLRANEEIARYRRAGPMFTPERDDYSDLGALLRRRGGRAGQR